MALSERIQQGVARLPARLQTEVLDFVEYLLTKTEREAARHERKNWSSFSLSSAMRDVVQEDVPTYTLDDLNDTDR